MPNQTKIKPLPLSATILNSTKIAKKNLPELILIIFLMISIIIAALFLLNLLYFLLIKYNVVKINYLFTFNFIWQIFIYILSLGIAAIAQIMLIQQMLTPEVKFKSIIKSIKNNFLSFLVLMFAINIIFLIASLPIYTSIFIFLLGKTVISIISLVLGIILTLLFAGYFIFSPFILIEEKTSWLKALKDSFALSGKNLPNIIYKLIILAIIFIILNGLAIIIMPVPYVGTILGSIIFLLMIIFTFTYLFALYREFKA